MYYSYLAAATWRMRCIFQVERCIYISTGEMYYSYLAAVIWRMRCIFPVKTCILYISTGEMYSSYLDAAKIYLEIYEMYISSKKM